MKHINMLVWLTQLGLSVAVPLGGFLLLALWLRSRFDLGVWVLIAGLLLGLVSAVDGFRSSVKAMERMDPERKKQDGPPPVCFNDHQ